MIPWTGFHAGAVAFWQAADAALALAAAALLLLLRRGAGLALENSSEEPSLRKL